MHTIAAMWRPSDFEDGCCERVSMQTIARNLNSVAVRVLISVAYGVISKMRKFTLYRTYNYL